MTEENAVRRNACSICSASPQISEENALWPASITPTTVHSRCAKRSRSPMATPRNSRATLAPTTISVEPGRNRRPCATRTCGRSASPRSARPRIGTLLRLPVLSLISELSTTTSREACGSPRASRATCGSASISAAWSRVTPLCTSVTAPLRITTTLSAAPVPPSEARRPASSISTAANTNTTSAMPPAVSTVVSLRTHRLRAT